MNNPDRKDARMLGRWIDLGRTVDTEPEFDHWYGVAQQTTGRLVAGGNREVWRFFRKEEGAPRTGWYPAGFWPLLYHPYGRSTLTSLTDDTLFAIGVNPEYSTHGLATNRAVAAVYHQVPTGGEWWTVVAPPPTPCVHHAAALLGNGKVMVAGGVDPTFHYPIGDKHPHNALAAAQLFDPDTRQWTTLPSLPVPRHGGVLVPLGAAGALLVGGEEVSNGVPQGRASVQVFVQGKGWHPADPMKHARLAPSAVTLGDGRVLVAGDGDTIEIFDPRYERWEAPVKTLYPVHGNPPVGVLADGSVLVGLTQLYDPVRKIFKPIMPNAALEGEPHIAFCVTQAGAVVVLADNEITGSIAWSFDIHGGVEEEPAGKWHPIGEPYDVSPAAQPMLATLPGGHVLATDRRASWRYDRTQWQPAGELPVEVFDRMFCQLIALANGNVLAIGYNTDFDEHSDSDYVLTTAYTQGAGWSAPSRMVVQRAEYGAALLSDGSVLVAGGWDLTKNVPPISSVALRSAEIYDPKARMWRETVPMITPRTEFVLVRSPTGRGAVAIGGRTESMTGEILKSAEMFSEDSMVWIHLPPMQVARYNAGALTLPDGRILVVSDDTLEVLDVEHLRWEEPVTLMYSAGKYPVVGLLKDGRVLIGHWKMQIYDPIERTCHPAADIPLISSRPGFCDTTLGTVMVWSANPDDQRGSIWEFESDGR
jgi:hypothetical protein